MVNDEIFQDIPQFNSITMAQNQYDLLFLFEKPEVCFTVVEYLDPSYNTIVETYTEKSKQKNKQYSLRIALFTFQGLRCCGIGLAGHLFNTKFRRSRNLPEFHYEWDITKQGIFDIISKYIPESRDFIICTDDDEEGELIGYSVLKAFGLDPYKYRRIRTYTFRNKTLFLERFTTPSYLEKGVVQSTITRHILDMIWGKNFSRLLGRGIKILSRGIHISIGRVQTPTLRFIKDRLDERESFEPKTNYYAKILFLQANGIDIEPENFIIFSNETDLTKFQEKHQFKRFYAKLINEFEEKEFADPLYNTDEALLDIEYYLKIPVSEGFEILKALYQGGIGVLSYPRTSSTNLPPGDYHSIITELAQKGWLSNINILKEKQIVIGKSAGEHPGLHPVAVPEQLSYKAKQVFQLIIRRFAATFAPPLRRRVRRFLLFPIKSVDGKDEVEYPQFKQTKFWLFNIIILMEQLESLFDDESILRLKTSEIRDLGYKQVTDPDETIEKDILDEGEGVLFVKKRVSESLRPDLLSERDLLKEMINSNLGTDATRPETIQNIQQWNFCEKLQDKLVLSELGEKILIASMETAEVITKPDLTRTLESEISKIRQQQEHPERVLENAFTVVREIIESVNLRNLVHMLQFEKCPKCGGITGLSRYGPDEPIRVKCSGKNCRYSRLLG